MPNTRNAKYSEWKVWFEKYFQYIADMSPTELSTLDRIEQKKYQPKTKLILVGHSLGATFLVKYLSEHFFPRHIDALHLVSPAYDDTGLVGESLASFMPIPQAFAHIHRQVG